MASRSPSYSDLDALLRRLGFGRRTAELPRYGLGPGGQVVTDEPLELPPAPVLLYENPAVDASVLLPQRPLDAPVEPQHLLPTRRQLIERGLIDEDDFDRWLCGVRFGDVCREPATTGTAERRRSGATH